MTINVAFCILLLHTCVGYMPATSFISLLYAVIFALAPGLHQRIAVLLFYIEQWL